MTGSYKGPSTSELHCDVQMGAMCVILNFLVAKSKKKNKWK